MVLSFVIRWYNRNRTTKCLKRLQKRSIDNLRQLVLIRQDRVLLNWRTCFYTSDSDFFFSLFQKKWVGRAKGNETFNGDGLTNASVNSSGAHTHPLPPGANPRALAFFKKNGQIPRGGDEERGQMARPWYRCLPTLLRIFINQWIKRSTVQYFNTTAFKTSRTTVRAGWFWLYRIFLYILFLTVC